MAKKAPKSEPGKFQPSKSLLERIQAAKQEGINVAAKMLERREVKRWYDLNPSEFNGLPVEAFTLLLLQKEQDLLSSYPEAYSIQVLYNDPVAGGGLTLQYLVPETDRQVDLRIRRYVTDKLEEKRRKARKQKGKKLSLGELRKQALAAGFKLVDAFDEDL